VLTGLDRDRRGRVDPRRSGTLVSPDPVPRHHEERRVGHKVKQIIKAAVGLGRRPTVQFGLDPQYPVLRHDRMDHQSTDIHRRVF
jgi:hypothetical protein